MHSEENNRWIMNIALDENESVEARKQALFWAGQTGGSITDLVGLYSRMQNREMKEQLIFVYSQRNERAAVDKLLEIARTDGDREMRKKALFWLAIQRSTGGGPAAGDHRPMTRAAFIVLGLAGLVAIPASAQSLAARIGEARSGSVRFSYASREDVCGNGDNNIQTGRGRHYRNGDDDDDYEQFCDYGPVRIRLTLSDGEVTRLRVSVGGRLRENATPATDLGMVSVREATDYLFSLARRSRTRAGGEAVFAVTLADSIMPWPEMLRIARDENIRRETQAVGLLARAGRGGRGD